VYIGRDSKQLRALERQIPTSLPRVCLRGAIRQQAMALRRPFLQFMTEQMLVNDPDVAWSSCFFENNTIHSALFLNLCSLRAIESYLQGASLDFLLIVVEQEEVLSAISLNFPSRISGLCIDMTWRETWHRLRGWLLSIAVILARPVVFVGNVLWEWYLTQRSRKKAQPLHIDDKTGEVVLLRTWVENSSFDNKGLFQDRYLPNLAEWLVKNGFRVIRLPVPITGCLHSLKIMAGLRNPKNTFLVPWDFLRFKDLAETLWVGLRQCWITWKPDSIEGWNLAPLFRAERRRYALARRGLFAYLDSLLVRRLGGEVGSIARCIYTFENMLPEKIFVRAFKRHFPSIPLIGFQHSALYPLKLDLYIDGRHLDRLPLPDKVVCSGPLFRKILEQEYAPFQLFDDGPALRFAHLFNMERPRSRQDCSTVLVVLPGYLKEATELLGKVIECVKDRQFRYCFHIKPHPLMSKKSLSVLIDELGGGVLGLEIVTGSLSQLFATSGAVITIASSVVLEAVAAGIPVIQVWRESDLDMDPLDWMDLPKSLIFQAASAMELKREVHRAMTLTDREREELLRYAGALLDQELGVLSDDRFQAFIR